MKFSVKKRVNLKLRDVFRVEALEPRVLLSADPIIGMAAVMLPADAGHDFLIHDAYQGAAPAPDNAYHAPAGHVVMPDAPVPAAAAATPTPTTPPAPPAPPAAATTTISSSDPTRTIFLGDDAAGGLDSNGALYISNAALGELGNGYSHILVGGADSNAHIVIGDKSGQQGVTLHDSLTLMNPQAGGEIFINQKLSLEGDSGLTIFGSGHTTIISSQVSASFAYINDSVKIDGSGAPANTISLTATNGGIQIGGQSSHSLNGDGIAPDDYLVLSATGDVHVVGTVGDTDPLEGLTVAQARNVNFDGAVTVNGNLDIHASGTVTFSQAVHLTAGSLHITGASIVYFQGGVIVDGGGDIFLEGDEIDLNGGEGSIIGTGVLTLRPSTVGMNIDVAGPPLENSADLNLSTGDLGTLSNTFSKIVIGRQDGLHADQLGGDVRIGAIQVAQQFSVRDQLEVYGKNISVADFANAGYQFIVDGKLTLDAYHDIIIANTVEAHNANVVLYAETGAIKQIDGVGADGIASETVRGFDLHAHAGNGISLPWLQVNTVSAVNTGDGDLIVGNLARDSINGIGGALQVDEVSQTSLLGDAIGISTSAGSITIAGGGAGVHTVSGGAIGISAGGAASQIVVNQGIGGTSGAIALAADGIVNVALGTIADSGAGAITLTSTSADILIARDVGSAGGLVHLGAGGAVSMVSGTHLTSLDASGDTGAVTVNAVGAITVSIVNADGAIGLASSAGAIVDGLTGNGLNLDGDTATATLAAATGIGSAAPLYTRVAAMSATNTVSGNVFVREATALRLLGASLAGSGASLGVVTVDGGIVVEGTVNSSGASGSGNILLQSGEASEATAADISVRANIGSNLGSISLVSADNVRIDDLSTGTPLIEARAAGKTIDIGADGLVFMEAGARLQTNNGNIRVEALGGDITLGIASAGSAAISLRAASGNILDGQGDDAVTRVVNLTAANLRLNASGSIGSSTDTLEVQAGVLALAGRAGYVLGSTTMSVGSVAAVAVDRVAADASVSALADSAALAGAAAANGDLVLSGAALSLDQAVSASGNLLVQAAGTLAANAAASAGNNISMLASGQITQNGSAVFSALAGTIDVAASAGVILMADGARALTNAQNIRYQASGAVTVSLIDARSNTDRNNNSLAGQAGWGAVSVKAGGGILDAAEAGAATDIYAGSLRLNAAAAIGNLNDALDIEAATLSGASGSSTFLNEASAITVGSTAAVTVNRVLPDGTVTASVVTDAAQSNLASTLKVVLQAGGTITSTAAGAISGGGNILLASTADIVIGAAIATTGANGNISLNAGRDILQNANIGAAAAVQSIDLLAARDIVMADTTASTTNGGNIALHAGGSATIETLNAGAGSVSIDAGGSILDQDANGDSEVDIVAANLRLNAGSAIGSGANAIETTVGTLSAHAGGGGLFIAETDGLILDSVTVQVNRVDASGVPSATSYGAQLDVAATGAGNVVVRATDITVNGGVSAAAGNLLLQASTGNLTLNAGVTSASGAVSLAAGAALAQKALVSGASIDAVAATAITMDDGVSAVASGNVRYQAGGNLAIGTISSGATASLKADSVSDSGSTDLDIAAATLRVETAHGFGSGAAHLQTTIGVLAGSAGAGGLFIDESDALQIAALGAVDTARVAADGTLGSVQDAAVASFSAGAAVISSAGAMSVDTGLAASGNLLLQTTGASADLSINQQTDVGTGSASFAAGRDLLVNTLVRNNSAAQSLDLQAARDIVLAQGSNVTATTGNILLAAGRNATIENLATAGSVSVTAATGAIVDGDSNGDSEVDISASGLLLRAATGIGSGANHLETTVSTLSAQGGSGGTYITETDSLTVDGVTIQVNRINAQGVASATANAMQNNLTATGSGNLVLRSNSGLLTISDNVSTAGGNLLLQAASGGLVINDAIGSSGGTMYINSAGNLAQKANISNSGAGTIELAAVGALSMDDGTTISGAANIRASAGTVMTVGAISTSGAVNLVAGAIADSGTSDIDVTASALRIVAQTVSGSGIGSGSQHLQVAVATLAGSSAGTAAGSGVFIDAVGSVAIDSIAAIAVNRTSADGTVSTLSSALTSDLTSAGKLVLTAGGAITVNQGIANGTGVSAAGNLLLKSTGATADIILNAEVLSTGGAVTINAGRDLLAASSVSAASAGASIEAAAVRAVNMAEGSLIQTNGGNVAVRAGSDATIELIDAGAGSIAVIAGGSIVDQDGAGDSDLDLIGGAVQLSAGSAIGSAASSLETQIATLSANAGAGGVYVSETDGLLIDSVAVQVARVDTAGVATLTTNATQANLTASGSGNIAVSAASIAVSDDVTSAAGAILLNARSGALTQNNAVTSTSGAISLTAAGPLAQKAAIGTASTVDVASSGGAIAMDDGVVTTAGGNVRYAALGAVSVGAIVSNANVSLSGSTIVDAGGLEVDVSAAGLRLSTSGAGDVHLQTAVATVAANVAGGLSLADSDALNVGSLAAIGVSRLAQDGSSSIVSDAAMAGLAAGGNLLLQTGGTGDLTVGAAAPVSAAGNISLNSARDIVQSAAIAASGTLNSIDLLAARDIVMNDAGVAVTDAGNVRLQAVAGAVTIGAVDARSAIDRAAAQLTGQAGWGAVSISAAGAIADNAEAAVLTDVYASMLHLTGASAGAAANYLETEVGTISAAAGAGGLFVQDASALAVAINATVGVNRVAFDGSTLAAVDAPQAGVVSGAAAVLSADGAINIGAPVSAVGNMLLQSGDDILVNGAVASSAGSVSLNAVRDIVQTAAISTAAAGKSIDLLAGRNIAMGAGSTSATNNGNLLLTAGGDITVATIAAGTGSVGINAAGSILDQDAAGDSRLNIGAAGLQVKAGNAIGAGANHLEIAVATLSASAGAGGMYLDEADGLTVSSLAVQAQRIDGAALATTTANAAQADLRTTSNGNIVLQSASGALVVNDGDSNGSAVAANGSGNILLSGGSVAVNAGIASATGNVSLLAAGAITMAGNTAVSGAQVRLAAGSSVALGNVTAASASIVAGSGAITAASGSTVNVNAASLRLQAGGAIGSGSARIATAVDNLAASGAGMYINEADSVIVTAMPAVTQVNGDGSSSASADSALAGLVSSANGSIVLSAGGAVNVADNQLVSANGSGNVLLQARSGALGLGLNADVVSTSGHVSVLASGAIALASGADVRTGGSGDIDIDAGGAFAQTAGSVIVNADGSVRLQAAGEVQLASIASVGNVAVTSLNGSIVDDGDAATDIAAEGLRLSAAGAIGKLGAGAKALDTAVGTVSARAGSGGINLSEASDIVVGDVTVAVNVVNADGSLSTVTAARQADLRTSANGSIVLNAANSFIILNEGSGAIDGAVVADGSGNVLLNAGVSIIANADINSGSGHVTLTGASLIEFKANADIRTSGAGAIDVEASTGAIVQNASSLFTTGSGNVRLRAQTDVTIGDIVTLGDASITAVAGSIRDADALVAGVDDADNDISARSLRLSAGAGIGFVDLTGSTSNALETAVGTLSARAGGAIGIANNGTVSVGSVAVSAAKVGLDGAATAVTDALQTGFAAGGALSFVNDGDLNIDSDVNASGGPLSLDSRTGAVRMAGTANVTASGNNLRLHAAGDVVVGNLTALNVSLVADSGAVVNAAGSTKNVNASSLRLQADDAIGSAARHLTTTVGTISAVSRGTDSTGIYVTEDDALTIGSAGFGVDAVQTGLRADGVNAAVAIDAGGAIGMAGTVNAAASGALSLHAVSGAITIANLSAASVALTADSGAIVNAAGSTKNIAADSAVLRASGAIGASSRALTTNIASLDASGAALYVAEDNAVKLTALSTASGNLVVTTIDGAIGVDGPVAAGRNVLLAANGAAADLTLTGNLTSATGSISLRAGRDVLLNGAVRASTATQTVDLIAARNLAMGEGSSIATVDSAVMISTGGDATIETIGAGSGNVGISAGGSVFDQDPAGDSGVDITASALRISAGGAIGTAGNRLETTVVTIAATASTGGLFLDEQDALTIGSVDVAVGRIDGAGVKTTVSAGALAGLNACADLAVNAAGAVSQQANIAAVGGVQLKSAAAIAMQDGVITSAASINYSAGGDIVAGLLDAGSGSVVLSAGGSIADAQASSSVQTVNVRAGSVQLTAGGAIGSLSNAIETALTTLSASAAGDIVISENSGLTIGAGGLSSAAGNVVIKLDAGTLDLAQAFTSAAGKDLTLAADHIVFPQTVRGNGGKLTLLAATPAGEVSAGGSGIVDQASLSHLAGGYAQVVLGAGVSGSGQDARLDGSAAPVTFNDALLLNVTGSGSAITVTGAVNAQSIDARGALAVAGNATISAGNGAQTAGGDMLFEQSIDGAAGSTIGAVLALAAGGDNVVIQGAIGASVPLAGFSISNAANVSFAQNVNVSGPVVIDATGVVRFDGVVTLDHGSLTIRGASEVIIGDVVFHGQPGVVIIEANTLTLNGDVQGAGTVRLHPTDIGRDIVVGGSGAAGAYNVTSAQLAHLASATEVLIGTQGADGHAAEGAGAVTLAAIDFAALTAAPIKVFGSVVTLAAGSGTLHAASGIVMDGRDGVVLHDSMSSVAGDIRVYSAQGAVTMDADAAIAGSAAVSIEGAGSLSIGLVQGKTVLLRSGGVIADAAADDKVNVTADSVSIIGYGPKLGAGNAIEVQAPSIYVSAPTGMVLQDTGSDGRTHFYLLDGATMYEQAVAIGTVARSTAAPAAVSANAAAMQALSAPVTAAAPTAFAAHAFSAASYLAGADSAMTVAAAQTGSLSAGADGLLARATAPAANLDYWLEDLML